MFHCHKCGRLCQLHKGKYVPSKECKCNKGKAMKCSPKRRPNSKSESKGVKIDEWLHKHPTKRKSSRGSSRRSSSGGFEVKKKKKSPVKARRSNSRKGTRVVARRVTVDKISSGYRYSNPLFDEKKMRASKKKKKKNKKSKNKNKK